MSTRFSSSFPPRMDGVPSPCLKRSRSTTTPKNLSKRFCPNSSFIKKLTSFCHYCTTVYVFDGLKGFISFLKFLQSSDVV